MIYCDPVGQLSGISLCKENNGVECGIKVVINETEKLVELS